MTGSALYFHMARLYRSKVFQSTRCSLFNVSCTVASLYVSFSPCVFGQVCSEQMCSASFRATKMSISVQHSCHTRRNTCTHITQPSVIHACSQIRVDQFELAAVNVSFSMYYCTRFLYTSMCMFTITTYVYPAVRSIHHM